MQIKDRSNGTEGSIQQLGSHQLTTSDQTVANAGAKTAYVGDGEQCDAQPAEFHGEVSQSAPALDKSHGVASAPQLMRAHQSGSISKDDAQAIHRGVQPTSIVGSPESASTLMPQTKSVTGTAMDTALGQPAVEKSAKTPVIAKVSGQNHGLPTRALPTRPGSRQGGPVTAYVTNGRPMQTRT